MFPDSKIPTQQQRQNPGKMLSYALPEIRGLGNSSKAEQAADLADAFHNLPVYLWSDDFSLVVFREFLQEYQRKYPETGSYDYLAMLDEVMGKKERACEQSPSNKCMNRSAASEFLNIALVLHAAPGYAKR